MQLFHFIAAWLFPGAAVSKVPDKATITEFMEHDNASSLAFSVKAAEDSCSSISSSSSSSSSSSDDHPRFFPSRKEQSPPASPLCFGAGRSGVGKLLLLRGSRGARARSPTKQHGDVVGRYLRRISRRLRKARRVPAADQVSPSSPGRAADDTVRERAEAVARAVAYCKDTLRRGAAPPPSPSLDDWLHDWQDEILASTAAYGDGSTYSHTPAPPSPPRLDGSSLAAHFGIGRRVSQPLPPRAVRRDGELAEVQATGKQGKESTCSAFSSGDCPVTSINVVHGKELPPIGHDDDALDSRFLSQSNTYHACQCLKRSMRAECSGESSMMAETAMSSRMRSSLDEMELLNILDGDEEMIGRHFITIQI
jgi:hypothetical protein